MTFKKHKESRINIRPLAIVDIVQFLNLRNEIERESLFMPTDSAGRRELVLYAILKLLWHRNRIVNLVAIQGREIVGFATIIFGRFRKFKGNAYIANVSVKSNHRGRGIGRDILKNVEELAQTKRARRLELEVFAKNVAALQMYKKLGYKVEGIKRRAVESHDGFDDIVFMAKFIA
jgi:ribosomal protein S18 acetylase RimI-like enzyme